MSLLTHRHVMSEAEAVAKPKTEPVDEVVEKKTTKKEKK